MGVQLGYDSLFYYSLFNALKEFYPNLHNKLLSGAILSLLSAGKPRRSGNFSRIEVRFGYD
jgi:hypothetical protein